MHRLQTLYGAVARVGAAATDVVKAVRSVGETSDFVRYDVEQAVQSALYEAGIRAERPAAAPRVRYYAPPPRERRSSWMLPLPLSKPPAAGTGLTRPRGSEGGAAANPSSPQRQGWVAPRTMTFEEAYCELTGSSSLPPELQQVRSWCKARNHDAIGMRPHASWADPEPRTRMCLWALGSCATIA